MLLEKITEKPVSFNCRSKRSVHGPRPALSTARGDAFAVHSNDLQQLLAHRPVFVLGFDQGRSWPSRRSDGSALISLEQNQPRPPSVEKKILFSRPDHLSPERSLPSLSPAAAENTPRPPARRRRRHGAAARPSSFFSPPVPLSSCPCVLSPASPWTQART